MMITISDTLSFNQTYTYCFSSSLQIRAAIWSGTFRKCSALNALDHMSTLRNDMASRDAAPCEDVKFLRPWMLPRVAYTPLTTGPIILVIFSVYIWPLSGSNLESDIVSSFTTVGAKVCPLRQNNADTVSGFTQLE